MRDKVLAWMQEQHMTKPGQGVLVALSGGADSTALLRVLLELAPVLQLRVEAAHVHHGIRGAEADRDEAFCKALCDQLDIPLSVHHCDVPTYAKQQGMGIEQAAREVRYQALEDIRCAHHLDAIATAHHREDNAETLLFRLARGTGLAGLCGIPPVRGCIIRPLLCVGRGEIEVYLQECGQDYVTDSTNAELSYSRNRIRSRVLPELEQISHGAVDALCRLAQEAVQDNELLEQMAHQLWESAVQHREWGISLPVSLLAQAHPALASRALRQIYHMVAGQELQRVHVDALLTLIRRGMSGSAVYLPRDWVASVDVDMLCLTHGKCGERQGYCIAVQHFPAVIEVPETKFLVSFVFSHEEAKKIQRKLMTTPMDYDTIKHNLVVRSRRPGDRLRPCGFHGARRLKKMMAEARIPLEWRDCLPLIVCGGVVAACPGLRPDAAYMAHPDTRQVIYAVVSEREGEGKDRNHASGSGSHPFDRGAAERESTRTGSTDLP